MAAEALPPTGCTACTWVAFRTPYQVDADTYQNVDEGMTAIDTSDIIGTNAIGKTWDLTLPTTSLTGAIATLKVGFNLASLSVDSAVGLTFQVFLDDVAVTTKRTIFVDTFDAFESKQLTWVGKQLYSMTAAAWNAAAERTLRITSLDGGGASEEPGPYFEEIT